MNTITTPLVRGPSIRSIRHFLLRNCAVDASSSTPKDVSEAIAITRKYIDESPEHLTVCAITAIVRLVRVTASNEVASSLSPAQTHAIEWIDARLVKLCNPQEWLAAMQIAVQLLTCEPPDDELITSFLYWL